MRAATDLLSGYAQYHRDQRNIVSLVRMPGGERESMYFAAGDKRAVEVKW